MRGISWLAANQLAAQEGLWSMERILFLTESTHYCCPVLMKLEFSQWIVEKKNSTMKFHENLDFQKKSLRNFMKNPSSGRRHVSLRPGGRTYEQADMTKLSGAFREYWNASTKLHKVPYSNTACQSVSLGAHCKSPMPPDTHTCHPNSASLWSASVRCQRHWPPHCYSQHSEFWTQSIWHD